jgi:hypothetical protein
MAVNSLQKQPASFGAGRRDKRLLTEERPGDRVPHERAPAIRTHSMCTYRSPGRSGSKGNLEDAKAGLAKVLTLKPEINSLTRLRQHAWMNNPSYWALREKRRISACDEPVSQRNDRPTPSNRLRVHFEAGRAAGAASGFRRRQ